MAATYPGSVTGESDPIAEADLAAHVAAADPHPQYQKESEKAQANGYASLDGGGQVPLSQLGNAPAGGGGGGADASTTVKGISKLSTAPASPTNPIAVGDNDPRNSDARTPTAHAASHASAGSDPVTIAESQVTNLVSDLAAKAPLASPALTGTPTVPTAAQGTNTTQAASTAYVQTETGLLVPKSLVDAKGDLIVGSADNTVIRKAVGTDGQVLTADAASAGGVRWATPSGGGSSLAPNLRVFGSTHITVPSSVSTFLDFDSESFKSGITHTATPTNLTGTVAKTNASNALVGTGTAFTTELKVGDQIIVPGGASETRVVTAITDATHLTVSGNFANTASGQIGQRVESTRATIVTAGIYSFCAGVWFPSNSTGVRNIAVCVNGAEYAVPINLTPVNGDISAFPIAAHIALVAGDYVQLEAWQTSGTGLAPSAGSKRTWMSLVKVSD